MLTQFRVACRVTLFIRSVEPLEGLIRSAESRSYVRERGGRHVLVPGSFDQLLIDGLCLIPVTQS